MLTLTTFRAVPWNLAFYARLGFVEIPRDWFVPSWQLSCPTKRLVWIERANRDRG